MNAVENANDCFISDKSKICALFIANEYSKIIREIIFSDIEKYKATKLSTAIIHEIISLEDSNLIGDYKISYRRLSSGHKIICVYADNEDVELTNFIVSMFIEELFNPMVDDQEFLPDDELKSKIESFNKEQL